MKGNIPSERPENILARYFESSILIRATLALLLDNLQYIDTDSQNMLAALFAELGKDELGHPSPPNLNQISYSGRGVTVTITKDEGQNIINILKSLPPQNALVNVAEKYLRDYDKDTPPSESDHWGNATGL